MPEPLTTALLITLTILSVALLGGQIYLARKIAKMSTNSPEYLALKADLEALAAQDAAKAAQIVQLNTDKAALAAQVETLTAQLAAAPAGTSDADLAALDAEVKAALDPAAPPAPEPTPETPPAAT